MSTAPPAAIGLSRIKRTMTLDEIVNEVHAYLEPVRAQCGRFCEKVEEYATMVGKYASEASRKYTAEYKKREKERKRLGVELLPGESWSPRSSAGNRMILPTAKDEEFEAGPPHEGWIWTTMDDFSYLDLRKADLCWRPPEPPHPVGWLLLRTSDCGIIPARATRPWTNDERFICECFRVATIHDYQLLRTSSPHEKVFFGTPYSGRFRRDAVAQALWDQMEASPRGLEDLQLSWNWVRHRLEELQTNESAETPDPGNDSTRNLVFISYNRKDEKWLSELQVHLKPYIRNELLTTWSDQDIAPGEKWFTEIEAALASTKVAVLLVTKDFLASDFIAEHELTPLLKQAEAGNTHILWIPVGTCSYKETGLKDYQAVIDPAKPLEKMQEDERNTAWVKICEAIKKAVNR